jgi:predicted nucleic acid-binding protein
MPGCRAVLDTNVVLAAHRATDPASPNREILNRWKLGGFLLLYSADIVIEYAEKLLEHGFAESDVRSYLALVRLLGERVDITFFHVRDYPSDSDDIGFLLCALNGEATHLVSYDDDLLALQPHYALTICEPMHFLADLRVP